MAETRNRKGWIAATLVAATGFVFAAGCAPSSPPPADEQTGADAAAAEPATSVVRTASHDTDQLTAEGDGVREESRDSATARDPNASTDPASASEVARDPNTPAETAATETTASPEPDPVASEPQAGRRILVSIEKRRLWLVDGKDTLLRAPVAIGMGQDFTYNGRKYHFATPRGTRKVLAKVKDPVWIVPEWHYYEKATKLGIDNVVKLENDAHLVLADSSILEVRDDQVGRVNHFGNFSALTPGTEIIFDHTMFIPPISTAQRRVPNALGPFKLDTGDGYLIHGTHLYNEETIGEAVSHGCVRMTNEDLTRLFPLVPRGTPVIIY